VIRWPIARPTRASDNQRATAAEWVTEAVWAIAMALGIVEAIVPTQEPLIAVPEIAEMEIAEVIGPVQEPAIEGETAAAVIVWGTAVFRRERMAAVAHSAVPQTAVPARVRAVREAPRAWAQAALVVAAEGGGNPMTKERHAMSKTKDVQIFRSFSPIVLVALLCALTIANASSGTTAPQKTFPTPQASADALIQAAGSYDLPALEQILGPGSEDLLKSEDTVRDKNTTAEFVTKAHQKTQVAVDPKNPNRATVVVGDDDWPLPIPIVKKGTEWSFDTPAGREEMLLRRIGSNELDAIEICRGYVDAQFEYALEKHDNSEVNQYAQKIISSPGKHDGLVWYNGDGTLGGPISEGIAEALSEGYTDKSKPYHGYYFKILKGQGPAAPLGEMNFVVEGAMIGGFALAAAPADYRVTGVKTFIVSYEGTVYQKDLGPDTLKIFSQMELYNPDKTWTPTYDNW